MPDYAFCVFTKSFDFKNSFVSMLFMKKYSKQFKENTYKKYNNEYVTILKRYEKEFDPRIDFISKLDIKNKKILDIGCGTGKISSLFVNNNEVYGIDISSKILEIAKKRGIITKQLNLDQENIPFKDRSFDVIFLFDSLEHVFLPEKLLKDSCRLLKNNGLLYITTHNIKDDTNITNEYDLSLFDIKRLKRLLRKLGFKDIKIYGWSWSEPRQKSLVDYLKCVCLWYNPRFAKDIYIVAKK